MRVVRVFTFTDLSYEMMEKVVFSRFFQMMGSLLIHLKRWLADMYPRQNEIYTSLQTTHKIIRQVKVVSPGKWA